MVRTISKWSAEVRLGFPTVLQTGLASSSHLVIVLNLSTHAVSTIDKCLSSSNQSCVLILLQI